MNFLKKYVEKPNILVNQIEIYVEGKNSLNGTLIIKYNPTRRVRQQSLQWIRHDDELFI